MCSAMHTDWVDISGVTVHPHDASGQAIKKNTVHVCVTVHVLHLQIEPTPMEIAERIYQKKMYGFVYWMKNKVNTMHGLELAIGLTSNYDTVI